MTSNAPVSGRLDAPGARGSGVRAFGARVAGVLLLVPTLGLGYLGVVWAMQEPFVESVKGTIVVQECRRDGVGHDGTATRDGLVRERAAHGASADAVTARSSTARSARSARSSTGQWCDGTFTSEDGAVRDPYASIDTDEPYAKGDRVGAYRLGEESGSYNTSLTDASASGFRALFTAIALLGPVVHVLVTGGWPARRTPGARRPDHPVFWQVGFPLICVGLSGFLVASVVGAIA